MFNIISTIALAAMPLAMADQMLIEEKMSRNLNGIDNDDSSDIEAIFLNLDFYEEIYQNNGYHMEAGQENVFLLRNSRRYRNRGYRYMAQSQFAAPAFEITEIFDVSDIDDLDDVPGNLLRHYQAFRVTALSNDSDEMGQFELHYCTGRGDRCRWYDMVLFDIHVSAATGPNLGNDEEDGEPQAAGSYNDCKWDVEDTIVSLKSEVEAMSGVTYEKFDVFKCTEQVVNGMNYWAKVEINDDQGVIHVKIHEPFEYANEPAYVVCVQTEVLQGDDFTFECN